MRPFVVAMVLLAVAPAIGGENVVHDDGTGAQISFALPVNDKVDGKDVTFTTFRLVVRKAGKFLLFTDLPGKTNEDGKTFSGKIIIPSEMIGTAEILMLGSHPNPKSSRGVQKEIKVSTFKVIKRDKSWTEQK
jgi:hypothetical protein